MILFKKQFLDKILDWTKTVTWRNKIYFKQNTIVSTNFVQNWKRIKIYILDIKNEEPNFDNYIEDGFNSKQEMENYFSLYKWQKLFKISFKIIK